MNTKTNINQDINQMDQFLRHLLKSNDNQKQSLFNKSNIDKSCFKQYFIKGVKKWSFLAQILPSVLFLIISLVSFSVAKIFQESQNFGFIENFDNFLFCITIFGFLFLFLGSFLLVQRFVFKTRTILIKNGFQKGYRNISKKTYNLIVEILK